MDDDHRPGFLADQAGQLAEHAGADDHLVGLVAAEGRTSILVSVIRGQPISAARSAATSSGSSSSVGTVTVASRS